MTPVEKRLKKAKIALTIQMPFFGQLLLNCRIRKESKVPTMATDGKDIFYNEDFVNSIPKKGSQDGELLFIFIHEVMHKIFMHCERMYGRDRHRINVAGDYIINDFIRHVCIDSAGGTPIVHFPDGALIDKDYTRDWTLDSVYQDMVKKFDPDKQPDPQHLIDKGFKPDDGGDVQQPAKDKAGQKLREEQLKREVAAARNAQKQAGKSTAAIDNFIDEFIQPKVDWKKHLREFVQMTGKNDTSFRRPNRRLYAHDMYLPIIESESCPHLCVVFDVSGSIYCNQKILQSYLSELNTVIEEHSPDKVTVIYTDTTVIDVKEITPGDQIPCDVRGGGGTDFEEVMKYVIDMEDRPAALLFFTDLYCHHGENPEVPVMWFVYDNPGPDYNVPYGKAIKVELDDD